MAGTNLDKSTNDVAYARWKANGGQGIFVAILDGDDVASGNNYPKIALDACDLATQRGKGTHLTIYNVADGEVVPR